MRKIWNIIIHGIVSILMRRMNISTLPTKKDETHFLSYYSIDRCTVFLLSKRPDWYLRFLTAKRCGLSNRFMWRSTIFIFVRSRVQYNISKMLNIFHFRKLQYLQLWQCFTWINNRYLVDAIFFRGEGGGSMTNSSCSSLWVPVPFIGHYFFPRHMKFVMVFRTIHWWTRWRNAYKLFEYSHWLTSTNFLYRQYWFDGYH